jgi:hypothetical protein
LYGALHTKAAAAARQLLPGDVFRPYDLPDKKNRWIRKSFIPSGFQDSARWNVKGCWRAVLKLGGWSSS